MSSLRKDSKLRRALMSEEEIAKVKVMDFATILVAEVEKLVEKHGKKDVLRMINKEVA